jgi:hypothetical protein
MRRVGSCRAARARRWPRAWRSPGARMIVATDLDGDAREATVRQAVAITETEVRGLYADRIRWVEVCEWSKRDGTRAGAAAGTARGAGAGRPAPATHQTDAVARAALEGVRLLGLPWSPAARRLRARARLARSEGWPGVEDADLLAAAEDWLLPHSGGAEDRGGSSAGSILCLPCRGCWAGTGWPRWIVSYPEASKPRLGRKIPIDYDGDVPAIEVRLQEMFGVTVHPVVGASAAADPGHAPVARPRPGAGDDRPAPVLGDKLCRCQEGHARGLSAPPLARGPDSGRADAKGETAGDLREPKVFEDFCKILRRILAALPYNFATRIDRPPLFPAAQAAYDRR